jgi:hypothetical protein
MGMALDACFQLYVLICVVTVARLHCCGQFCLYFPVVQIPTVLKLAVT